MKNNGLLIKIAVSIVSVAFIAYGFYVLTDYRLGAVELKTTTMAEEGCKPALQNKLDIALIRMSMSNIQADQADIKVEQKAIRKELQIGLKEILRRLPPSG